ncbi:MAG: hypothetical protein VR70_06720 [Rhodospirillaceae bacterium BRH_c57]|nr:MAG: hypothetical protein VR70_06720 [Rhodospirillaceae bacterium BRH_c57]
MALVFDSTYYLSQNPDVLAAAAAGLTTAEAHFNNFGWKELRNPNAVFDTSDYLTTYADVLAAQINPLTHFLAFGAAESRTPSTAYATIAASFDSANYLSANPDVQTAVTAGTFTSAYQHWVLYGQYETARPVAQLTDGTLVTAVTSTGTAGTTFTLTTNIDSITGTTANDTIIADAGALSAADAIDGGTGTDTLRIYGSLTVPDYKNIETLELNGPGVTTTYDVSGKSALTTLNLIDPTTVSTFTIGKGQAVGVSTMVAGESLTLAGNAVTSLDLTANSLSATGADVTLALTGTSLATLNLATTGAKSQLTLTNAGGALTAINISGTQSLELGHALTTVTTIDASKSTGAVDIDTIGASSLKFTGGTGNDRINTVATLTLADTLDGGAGTDTLALTDADLLTTANTVNVKNFEILEALAADGTAYNVDNIGLTNNPLTGIVISTTGGATSVTNINSGAINNIKLTADTPTSITLSGKDFLSGGTSDTATIILDNSVDKNADGVDVATALTFTNVDILNVSSVSDGTPVTGEQNSIAGLTATDLDKIVVTGDNELSITLAATTASLQEVDVTASTAANTLVTTAAALPGFVYRGNSKVDTVTALDAATNAVTAFTGGGSDVLELGVTGATHALNFTATDFTTGDIRAGNVITINAGNAFQAGDIVTINLSSVLEGLLKVSGTTLAAAAGNVTLVGTALVAGTTNVNAVDGGNNTVLQVDINNDGVYTAADDFAIDIMGLANNTLAYTAATDLFTFTATA